MIQRNTSLMLSIKVGLSGKRKNSNSKPIILDSSFFSSEITPNEVSSLKKFVALREQKNFRIFSSFYSQKDSVSIERVWQIRLLSEKLKRIWFFMNFDRFTNGNILKINSNKATTTLKDKLNFNYSKNYPISRDDLIF